MPKAASKKTVRCYNCGKVIKGKEYTKIGNYYCCKDCCSKGKKNKSCEFC